MEKPKRQLLRWTKPVHHPDVVRKDHLADDARLRVVVVLRERPHHPAASSAAVRNQRALTPPLHRRIMTQDELTQLQMCDAMDLARVVNFATRHDLAVVHFEPACRHVILEGTAARLNEAFGVELHWLDFGDHVAHGHVGALALPDDVAPVIKQVLGLDAAPFRRPSSLGTRGGREIKRRSTLGTPIVASTLVERYRYPKEATGRGQRIAIVALGGGYHASDLESYAKEVLGLESTPVVRAISVDGAKNAPLALDKLAAVLTAYNDPRNTLDDLKKQFGDDLGAAIATVETTMDVQLAMAAAPGAEIDVYFAPGTPVGMYDVFHATCGLHEATDENGSVYDPGPPTVVSLSWSRPEGLLAQSALAIEEAIDRAQCLGVCVVTCSGDAGSYGLKDPKDGTHLASVMYPAASPSVLAVGGTQFGDEDGERVWNDDNRGAQQASGGGVSGGFGMPWWQQGRGVPRHGDLNGPAWISEYLDTDARDAFVGRGVPDVAAFANQIPGYAVRVGGVDIGAGGTSASTPMWAGLVARLCEALGEPVPWLPEIIYYPDFANAFANIVDGDNANPEFDIASYSAAGARVHRWSPCAGLGVPDGEALLRALRLAKPLR
jgi:kumamolisin